MLFLNKQNMEYIYYVFVSDIVSNSISFQIITNDHSVYIIS